MLQVISPCDLNGVEHGERDRPTAQGNFVYRFEGDAIDDARLRRQVRGQEPGSSPSISNLPTGDLQFLDAPYDYALVSNPKR